MNRSLMTFISASGFPAILALNTSVNAQSDVAQRLASRVEAANEDDTGCVLCGRDEVLRSGDARRGTSGPVHDGP